jgi:DNA-binding transcriptional MerR regulator
LSPVGDPRTVLPVARRVGLPERTVRYYDRAGIAPASERSPAGYRLYSAADERRLLRVKCLRGLGLPLAEVRRLLDALEHPASAAAAEALLGRLEANARERDRLRGELALLRRAA